MNNPENSKVLPHSKINLKQTFILFLKGFSMGMADLIPGISGSTIALILNVYHLFIRSIANITNPKSIKLLFSGKFKELFEYINLSFILPLVIGLFSCIFALSHLISSLLENYPIQFWAFFFGLILCSSLQLPDYSNILKPKKIILIILGLLSGYLMINLTPHQTPEDILAIFITGMISISTMLLPGISGSFMLVVIGKYEFMINAIKSLNLSILVPFSFGGLTVLILLPRFINWVFKNNKEYFIVFIAGFLIGSIKKIWPWKIVEPVTSVEKAISPFQYKYLLGENHLLSAFIFFILGILLILIINRLDRKSELVTNN